MDSIGLICDIKMKITEETKKLSLNLPMKINLYGNTTNPKRTFLLLHGFSLTGRFMVDFFQSIATQDDLIIAPNAPFPSPAKTKEGFIEGYSWYFYDPKKDHYFITYNEAAEVLQKAVAEYIHNDSKLIIIGYSQGGYLAPFAAQFIPQTKVVIMVAASAKVELLPDSLNYDIYTINGNLDSIVEFDKALPRVQEIVTRATKGENIIIENGHRLDPQYLNSVKTVLNKC